MPRPPLDIGTYGSIRCYQTASGWRATTKFRDYDGKTRPVERRGKTKAVAERNLKKALTERKGPRGDSLTPDSRFNEALALWLAKFQKMVDMGKRSPSSLDTYRSVLDRHVVKGLGELRIREMTVARIDAFLTRRWTRTPCETPTRWRAGGRRVRGRSRWKNGSCGWRCWSRTSRP